MRAGRSARPTGARPTRPAGTAAVGPGPRSRSRCSATPAPPGTASTGSRRRRAPCWPAALAERADRRVHLRDFAVVGAKSSDLDAQLDRALPTEPRRRGDPDRRQRRDPPGAAVGVGAAPLRGRAPAARRRRRGARRHLPRPRHDQADHAPAQAGRPRLVAPARGRPDDRGRSSRAAGRCRSARSSARSSRPRRRCSSARTSSTRPPTATARWRRCCCPRRWPRWAWSPTTRPSPRRFRGEGVLPITDAAIQAVNVPGTELGGTEVGGSRRGVRGLWVELRHRRRQPGTEGEVPAETTTGGADDPRTRGELPGSAGAMAPERRKGPGSLRGPGSATGCRGGRVQSLRKIARMRSRLV